MSAFLPLATIERTSPEVRFVPILLQKSFVADKRNFLRPLMRFVRRDVRDLIANQKNGHGASYRHRRGLQRRSRLKFDFRGIFGVVRFSTFATLSAKTEVRVAVDAWRAPKWVLDAHPSDQCAQLRLDLWPTSPSTRFPTPVTAKADPVPTQKRLGPNDHKH